MKFFPASTKQRQMRLAYEQGSLETSLTSSLSYRALTLLSFAFLASTYETVAEGMSAIARAIRTRSLCAVSQEGQGPSYFVHSTKSSGCVRVPKAAFSMQIAPSPCTAGEFRRYNEMICSSEIARRLATINDPLLPFFDRNATINRVSKLTPTSR